MEATTQPYVQRHLIRMTLMAQAARGNWSTTPLGEVVLNGHMDVALKLLVVVATRLAIRVIGLVAAAFLTCMKDLFRDVLEVGPAFGLDSRQVALRESVGFCQRGGENKLQLTGHVHTAVRWYLEWVRRDRRLPAEVEPLFRMACFRKMEARRRSLPIHGVPDLPAGERSGVVCSHAFILGSGRRDFCAVH